MAQELNDINQSGDLETLKLKGESGTHAVEIDSNEPWDDIQVNVLASRRGVNPPNDNRTYDYGIAGGVEFLCSGFDVDEGVDITLQTSHQMKLNSMLDLHIHYVLPTDGVGKKMKWQVDVVASGINGTWQAVAGSPFTREHTIGANEHTSHKLLDLCDIPAVNTTVSSLYRARITRIDASADEYSGEVYVDFIDGHYQKDTLGSRDEGVK